MDLEYPKNICFLCGDTLHDGSDIDNEHIFPQWVLRRFKKAGQFSSAYGPERQRQKFYSHKLDVHKQCNAAFKKKLEDVISGGKFTHDELWLWALKNIIGLKFFGYGHDLIRSKPDGDKNYALDEYPDDQNNLWELAPQYFQDGYFTNMATYGVLEIPFIYEEPSFYYNIHHELGIMMLALGEKAFIIFFRDHVPDERLSEYRRLWDQMHGEAKSENMPAQNLYDLFCAKVAIHNYFQGYGLHFDFTQPHNRWVETRIKPSIEAEDFFYEAFQIFPIRGDNGKITSYRMGEKK